MCEHQDAVNWESGSQPSGIPGWGAKGQPAAANRGAWAGEKC